MSVLRNLSINTKVLIPPIILMLALWAVAHLAINGLSEQRAALNTVNDIALHRATLLDEFAILSEQVHSDVFSIAVLRFMNLPEEEIQPVHARLEQGLSDLNVIYGQILNKWSLDETERTLLAQMKGPLDDFEQQARQAMLVVSQDPSFGVLLVRSSTLPFTEFRALLAELRGYQQAKIVRAEATAEHRAKTVRGIIIAVALLLALSGTLGTLLIGTRWISRPMRAMTALMRQLAAGDLSVAVAGLERRDEIGAMAQAVEVFRRNALERAQLHGELRESEERYRSVVENSHAGIVITDDAYQLVYANDELYRILGYPREEVVGRDLRKFFDDETRQLVAARYVRRQRGEDVPSRYEVNVIRQDGQKRRVEVSAAVIKDSAGNARTVGQLLDITERKRVEETIQQANAELQRLVSELSTLNRITQAVTTVTDLGALLTTVAREMVQLFDASASGITLLDGARTELRVCAHYSPRGNMPDLTGRVVSLKDNPISVQVIETRQPVVVPQAQTNPLMGADAHDLLRQQGTHCLMIVPLLSRGEVVGTIGVDTDQAARVFTPAEVRLAETVAGQIAGAIENARLFEEEQQARRAAEAANRAKSVFLANISHELRTPLNAILGFSELMTRNPNLSPDQRRNLETIGRSGEHLLALINDVLELSKIEAGRVELRTENFDLHHMLLGLGEMFSLRAKDEGLTLVVDLAPGVPQYVRADQGKLRQVLINLLENAVKFTHAGDVMLRVWTEGRRTTEDERRTTEDELWSVNRPSSLVFEVEDTGVGIAPDELEAAFDAFVQTSSGKESQRGTGLGLPISRHHVQMMGGELRVMSEPGQGTRFEFDVPVEVVEAAEVETAQPTRRAMGLTPGQPAYRLLVAEDAEASRTLLVKLLASLGCQVREATNGQQAIEIWKGWRPHLIFMDMRMPVLDGREATRHIKAAPQGQETVIVALTASAFEEDRAAALVAGCDDFVRKPFREADIFNVLTKHLGVRFVYEREDRDRGDREALDAVALADTPPGWGAALRRATREGDLARMLVLIEQVRERDGALAERLAHLARNFEYDAILKLIQQGGNGDA
jgi:two-component system sensor histidine kinase/response regulator